MWVGFASLVAWCRACEKITQPPAPFHMSARGFAGPRLLVTMLEQYANYQPLNHGRSCARLGGTLKLLRDLIT